MAMTSDLRDWHTIPMWSLLFVCSALLGPSLAAPGVSYPFNSQFPPVARVNQPYDFQLALSSFTPTVGELRYSVSGPPAWLSIDPATGRLYGTPGTQDIGLSRFRIGATDSSGTSFMDAMLFTVEDPPMKLGEDVSAQLVKIGKLSGPRTISIRPGTLLDIGFSTNTFTDSGPGTRYHATLANRTPLPAWLSFNPETLKFTGRAPDNQGPPQLFTVVLIASEVDGFEDASVNFTLAVSPHVLVFDPWKQSLRLEVGKASTNNLRNSLFLDGVHAPSSAISKLSANTPDWIHFGHGVFKTDGDIPSGVAEEIVQVVAEDRFGDRAMCLVHIKVDQEEGSLFGEAIDPIDATIGEEFRYTFSRSLFTRPDALMEVDLGSASSWLHFDPSTLTLSGAVPSSLKPSTLSIKLIARSGSDVEDVEPLRISLKQIASKPSSTSALDMPPLSGQPTSVSSPSAAADQSANQKATITIVTVCVSVFIILLICTCCFCRYKRYGSWPRSCRQILKTDISKSSVADEEEHDDIVEIQDAEKGTIITTPKFERPPRVQLDFSPVRSTKRFSRSSLRAMISPSESTENAGSGKHASRLSLDDCSLTEAEAAAMTCQAWDPSAPCSSQYNDSHATSRTLRRASDVQFNRVSKRFSKPIPLSRRIVGLGHGRGVSSLSPPTGLSSLNVAQLEPTQYTPRTSARGRDGCSTGSYSTQSTGLLLSASPPQFPCPPTFQRPLVKPFVTPRTSIPAPSAAPTSYIASDPIHKFSSTCPGSFKKGSTDGSGITRQSTSTAFFSKHRSYIPTRRSLHGSSFFHSRSYTPSDSRGGSGRGSRSRRWTAYVGKSEDDDLECLNLEPLRCYLPRERSSLRSSILFGDAREDGKGDGSDASSVSVLSMISHSDDDHAEVDAPREVVPTSGVKENTTSNSTNPLPPVRLREPFDPNPTGDEPKTACGQTVNDLRVAPGQENDTAVPATSDVPSPHRSQVRKPSRHSTNPHRRRSRALAERSTNTRLRATAEEDNEQADATPSPSRRRSYVPVARWRGAGRVRVLDDEEDAANDPPSTRVEHEGRRVQTLANGVSSGWMKELGLREGAIMSRGRESYRLWKEEGRVRERVERLEGSLRAGSAGRWEWEEGTGGSAASAGATGGGTEARRMRREKTISGDWETVREESEGMVFL